MHCNQKRNAYCVFAYIAKNNVTKKGFPTLRKTLFVLARFTDGNEKCEPRVCFPATAKTAKNPHTFREQRRTQTFPVHSIVAVRIFLQQKHTAVRCVQSSSVSPAVLRRCKAVYPCAYSRNKAKKRFVLVQRFMPAYALCRHIIKLYKKTMRAGTSTCLVRMRIFSCSKSTQRCAACGMAVPNRLRHGASVSARA